MAPFDARNASIVDRGQIRMRAVIRRGTSSPDFTSLYSVVLPIWSMSQTSFARKLGPTEDVPAPVVLPLDCDAVGVCCVAGGDRRAESPDSTRLWQAAAFAVGDAVVAAEQRARAAVTDDGVGVFFREVICVPVSG
ncbi:hypothetical protein X949_5204 [Burkholderia pseudomallei MSHR5609]|nr:hypothetical protein X949_5204 [Burkholderia pseudomallei MSHR5609]